MLSEGTDYGGLIRWNENQKNKWLNGAQRSRGRTKVTWMDMFNEDLEKLLLKREDGTVKCCGELCH
jgi:hypothetical protein